MTELTLTRALFRGMLLVLALIALVLLVLWLRYVLVQLFVAMIVAAGMAPLVAAVSDPERTRGWRWRPPRAMTVLVIYTVGGVGMLVCGALIVRALAVEGEALLLKVPEYASSVQTWIDD